MCDSDQRCLRQGQHPDQRHRFTQTKAERRTADVAARTGHLSTSATTKVGRYTLRPGDAVRLAQEPGKRKWLGVFQRLEHNAASGVTVAVVIGGKPGGACLTRFVDPARLIYLRPDSRDAKVAQTFVAIAKPVVGKKTAVR